jgi:hypothetical protein
LGLFLNRLLFRTIAFVRTQGIAFITSCALLLGLVPQNGTPVGRAHGQHTQSVAYAVSAFQPPEAFFVRTPISQDPFHAVFKRRPSPRSGFSRLFAMPMMTVVVMVTFLSVDLSLI